MPAGTNPRSPARRTPSSPPSPPARGLGWRAALLGVLGALAYANSLSGPLVLDDSLSIAANPRIRELWSLAVLWPERNSPVAGRPLVNVSFAVNYAIGRLDVVGYHAVNIAIHLCSALLVFGVARRTLQLTTVATLRAAAVNVAFAIALLWMLHPLNTEAVDYLTQRTESMMALFYLLTLYASIRALASPRAGRWRAAAVAACGLGMACKESMVTVPLLVALYDRAFVFPSFADAWRARWRLYGGLAAGWIVLAGLMASRPRGLSAGLGTSVGPWTYVLNQMVMIPHYLRLAVWPRSLVLNYGAPVPLTLAGVLPYALLVALAALAVVGAWVYSPALGFLGVWFFVTLAPASSVVPIATEVGAERRMYLPLVALVAIAVVAAASRLPRAATVVLGLAAAALAGQTIARNLEYRSELSLARTVAERWPTPFAEAMLGTALMSAGSRDEAVAHLRAALPGAPIARYNLGVELYNEGRLDEAIDELQRFVRDEPWRLEVLTAREIAGQALARRGRWPEAIDQFRRLTSMAPSGGRAQGLLADALFEAHAFDEAAAAYRAYLASRPNDARALDHLGAALAQTGRLAEAVTMFRRAVDLEPGDGRLQQNLATALVDAGDVEQAASHARRAVALAPRDPGAHDTLGRALALGGHLDEARAEFRRALEIDPASAQARDDLARVSPGLVRLQPDTTEAATAPRR